MSGKKLSITEKRVIDALLNKAQDVSSSTGVPHFPDVLKLLRKRLKMTQRVLAERAGMPTSYIGKIENGVVSPSLHTMQRIFSAMGYQLLLLPVSGYSPDEILEHQAQKAAETTVSYVSGTMALEDQLPEEEMQKLLIEEEKQRLLREGWSGLWEEK